MRITPQLHRRVAQNASTVDDATLDKLTKAFPILHGTRHMFYRSVRTVVGELRRGMKGKHPQPRRSPITKALGEYQAAVNKVRELITADSAAQSRDHVNKVSELITPDRDYARSFVLASLCGEDDATMTFICNGTGKRTDEVVADGVAFLDALDVALEKARPGVKNAFKDKGRKHGPQGNPAIGLFYHSLIYTIRSASGKEAVATSRTAVSSPKHLNEALKILRPYLPKDSPMADPWAIEKAGIEVNRLRQNASKNVLINRIDKRVSM